MHTLRCLAYVAQLEFNALLQETQRAIQDLARQRQSAAQAIEMAQQANNARAGPHSAEMVALVMNLLYGLSRLNAALDQVISEIEKAAACPDIARGPGPAGKTRPTGVHV